MHFTVSMDIPENYIAMDSWAFNAWRTAAVEAMVDGAKKIAKKWYLGSLNDTFQLRLGDKWGNSPTADNPPTRFFGDFSTGTADSAAHSRELVPWSVEGPRDIHDFYVSRATDSA